MRKSFVIEAVMIAVYGEMLVPSQPVEYIVPYSTIRELYELRDSEEPLLPDPHDEQHARSKIAELIAMLEQPFYRKQLERALTVPWAKAPLLLNDNVTFTIISSYENEEYGEGFDPIETELILTSMREQAPILTDQPELIERLIEGEIPVQVFDLDDLEFAVEDGIV